MFKSKIFNFVFFSLLLVIVFFFSLFLGTYDFQPLLLAKFLCNKIIPGAFPGNWPDSYETVILNIRLPRVLLAMLVGAALSTAGASFQGLFKNPLVEPYTLGLSTGAGFGAALALAFLPGKLSVSLVAFTFGLLAAFLAYSLARQKGETPVVSLVLAGVIVSALFSALISLVQYIVDPLKVQGIVFWLMGGLNLATWKDIQTAGPFIMFSILLLILLGWRLNILSLGDAEAKSLGLDVEKNKGLIVVLATLAASCAVAVSGVIGWIGLMVPHIVRMLVGPDHTQLLPLSALAGAAFLLLADDMARTIFTYEIPVGVITTLLGAPFFAYLLKKAKGGWM